MKLTTNRAWIPRFASFRQFTQPFFLFCILLAASAMGAQAATLTVTKTDDTADGVCNADCSLREAIAAANSGDTIAFASPFFDAPQIITLSDAAGFGQLSINKNLTVNGRGAGLLTVTRAASSPKFRIFSVTLTANVTLQGMTITNGADSGGGGGVLSGGTGTVTLRNCLITGNIASVSGGGVRNVNGTLVIENSTVSGNNSNLGGAGIHSSGGSFSMTNSTVSENINESSEAGTVGGIFLTGGTATLANSTVTDNRGDGTGSAGGILVSGGAALTIRNSIVAANRGNQTLADVAGTFVSAGYNLIGNAGTASGFGAQDLTGTAGALLDPRLSILANFGGPTPTHALLAGSPALDAADPAIFAQTDQRGIRRPINLRADIGAFERNFNFTNSPQGVNGNLPNAYYSQTYSVQFTVSRQTAPVPSLSSQTDVAQIAPLTFAVIAGSLPAGLSIDPNTGLLSGMPAASGSFNFTLRVTDGADGSSGAQTYSLTVNMLTAAGVSVSGRVYATSGRGLQNARVILTGARSGRTRTVTTGILGSYRFDEVAAGETFIITVESKQFRFAPQLVNVLDQLTELNFTPVR